MILTRKYLKVEEVVISETDVEALQVVVHTGFEDQRNLVVVYVPPNTNV